MFSEDERDHYITKGEIYRIRKDVMCANIQLDPNDAQSTQSWVDLLQSEGKFVYYKDKRDPSPEKIQSCSNLFILCVKAKFQKEAYKHLGDMFLGIDTIYNVTRYKRILLFTLL